MQTQYLTEYLELSRHSLNGCGLADSTCMWKGLSLGEDRAALEDVGVPVGRQRSTKRPNR